MISVGGGQLTQWAFLGILWQVDVDINILAADGLVDSSVARWPSHGHAQEYSLTLCCGSVRRVSTTVQMKSGVWPGKSEGKAGKPSVVGTQMQQVFRPSLLVCSVHTTI